VSKKSSQNPLAKSDSGLSMASYKVGFAEGRLDAIQESMDAIAELIFKAEVMIASLGEGPESAICNNADQTLRALHLAFAAVTGSVKGSPAFLDLLAQSRQRQHEKAGAMHQELRAR
jgi:hypothetical protein